MVEDELNKRESELNKMLIHDVELIKLKLACLTKFKYRDFNKYVQ